MTRLLLVCAVAGSALAAGIPTRTIYGNYMEARTADVYTGPCFANGEVGQVGELAVFGWNVDKGSWQGVDLSGLSVIGVVRARHTLGDIYESAYPVKSVLIVDSRASMEQRLALEGFAKHMGGDLLEDVVRVDNQPIQFTFQGNSVHSRVALMTAGLEAKIETRPIQEGDQICHNEESWYPPLTKLSHAMPAYTLANSFDGDGLGTRWSNPYKRSSFVGTFQTAAE